ncbi:LysR substrate-binding domain-containing protein, partial [Pseudomonas sp.]|uniref:LysR substrate-binding domain-containing protein n=1 Tax=Pseudomonas sp. TaxID=306 RepID=UPI0027BB057F
QQVSVTVAGNSRSHATAAPLEAARRGEGILAGGARLKGEDLARGRLVRVLPQWQLDVAAGIYLVRPTARLNTAALGAFKAWLEDRFKAGAPWRP